MSRPCPGSKRSPVPARTNASTRSFGSFATNLPRASMAKILPSTLRTESLLNIFRRLTRGSPANAATTGANLGSTALEAAGFRRRLNGLTAFAFAVMPRYPKGRGFPSSPRREAILPMWYQRWAAVNENISPKVPNGPGEFSRARLRFVSAAARRIAS